MGRRKTFVPEQHIGKVFHRLTVVGYASKEVGGHTFVCRCECGNISTVYYQSLRSENTKSCGCYRREVSTGTVTHGNTGKPLFKRYGAMMDRCNNANSSIYVNYGQRGIKVCEEWTNSYESFEKWSIENGFDEKLTIERIDNDGDYSPENCRWASRLEQANNRRSNRKLTFNGRTQNLRTWSNEVGIEESTLKARLDVLSWSVEKSLMKPTNKYKKGRER